jgi:hypothetical protein
MAPERRAVSRAGEQGGADVARTGGALYDASRQQMRDMRARGDMNDAATSPACFNPCIVLGPAPFEQSQPRRTVQNPGPGPEIGSQHFVRW